MAHESFTTISRGLERNTPIMRLYDQAKQFGIWNPVDLDLTQDILDWEWLEDDQRDMTLRLGSMFQAGKEAMTLDMFPLASVIARKDQLEEAIYLATFLLDEAKHVDFFFRFLDVVARHPRHLERFHTTSYQTLFYEMLPQTTNRIRKNSAPATQAYAAVAILVVEGVLSQTGHFALINGLEKNGLMPGLCKGIRLVQKDERRHITYSTFFLSTLIAHESSIWRVIESRLSELLTPCIGIIGEAFAAYEKPPFELKYEDFANYAMEQFNKCLSRLEKARGATIEQVDEMTRAFIDEDEK